MIGRNKIPPSWEVAKLGEVCTYSKGKKPVSLSTEKNSKNNIPYINIKAFEKGIFAEYTNGEKCNLCNDADLLMVWDGARCGLIGKAKKGAVGSTLMKILPKENIHKEYLYHFISSKFWTLLISAINRLHIGEDMIYYRHENPRCTFASNSCTRRPSLQGGQSGS